MGELHLGPVRGAHGPAGWRVVGKVGPGETDERGVDRVGEAEEERRRGQGGQPPGEGRPVAGHHCREAAAGALSEQGHEVVGQAAERTGGGDDPLPPVDEDEEVRWRVVGPVRVVGDAPLGHDEEPSVHLLGQAGHEPGRPTGLVEADDGPRVRERVEQGEPGGAPDGVQVQVGRTPGLGSGQRDGEGHRGAP